MLCSSEKMNMMMEITSATVSLRSCVYRRKIILKFPEPKFEKNIIFPLGKVQEMIDSVYCAITQEQTILSQRRPDDS